MSLLLLVQGVELLPLILVFHTPNLKYCCSVGFLQLLVDYLFVTIGSHNMIFGQLNVEAVNY